MHFPRVSFIVPNHNGFKFKIIEPCIASLLELDYPDYEVIMVDNNSTDGSVDEVSKSFGEKVRIIETHRNLYSDSLNQGAMAATGEYLVFLNNDTIVHRDYARIIIEALENDKEIGLAQGILLCDPNRDTMDNTGDFMDEYGNPVTRGRGEKNIQNYQKIEDILSASGSAFVIRKKVLEHVGWYSPLYHIGYEDMDLALRVWLAGYRVSFIPNAIVYHKRAVTDGSPELRMIVKHHFNKNRIMTIMRNYRTSHMIRVLPVALFFVMSAALYETLVQRNPRWAATRITGLMWCVGHLGTILKERRHIQKNVRKVKDDIFVKFMSKTSVSVNNFLKS